MFFLLFLSPTRYSFRHFVCGKMPPPSRREAAISRLGSPSGGPSKAPAPTKCGRLYHRRAGACSRRTGRRGRRPLRGMAAPIAVGEGLGPPAPASTCCHPEGAQRLKDLSAERGTFLPLLLPVSPIGEKILRLAAQDDSEKKSGEKISSKRTSSRLRRSRRFTSFRMTG